MPATQPARSLMARRIREARDELGLSQERFAERVGVSRHTPMRWEAGTSQPRMRQLKSIAAVTGKPVAHFLEDDDDEEAASMAAELAMIVRRLVHAELAAARGRA